MRRCARPEPWPPAKRRVTLAGRNVTRKVTEVTSFVTCYGIHYGIYYGIYYGFLDHFHVSLADAVHGLREESDTISRPLPLSFLVGVSGRR